MLLHVAVLILLTSISAFSAGKKKVPDWIVSYYTTQSGSDQKMSEEKTELATVSVEKYRFRGKVYYKLPPFAECCDIPTMLYTETGKSYCQLGGGFANHVDAKCADFDKAAKIMQTFEVQWKKLKQ